MSGIAAFAVVLLAGCAGAPADEPITPPAATAVLAPPSASPSPSSNPTPPGETPSAVASEASKPAGGDEPDTGGTPAPAGCTDAPSGFERSDDVDVSNIGDVDGDGESDDLWIASERTLGISTAAGGVATFEVESAAPSSVSAMATDADFRRPLELLVSDGRQVQLLVYDDCEIVPVIKADDIFDDYVDIPNGEPWTFDLGFRGTGTGVGCTELWGRHHLTGLKNEGRNGDWVDYTETVLELDGRTVTVDSIAEGRYGPNEKSAIDRLSRVTCGPMRMSDGVTTPTP